jgi:hypothetical protein
MKQVSVGCYRALAVAIFCCVAVSVQAQEAQPTAQVSDELVKRAKTDSAPQTGESSPMSDAAVTWMMNIAWQLLPEEVETPDGKTTKIDKSEESKFYIPISDARRVIRTASRSAYAVACELPDLEKVNYGTLMLSEAQKGSWSEEQLLFIDSFHRFMTQFFLGNVRISPDEEAGAEGDETAAADEAGSEPAQGSDDGFVGKRLTCNEQQKAKVKAAIEEYVRSAQAEPARKEATPVAPRKAPLAGSD